MTRGGICLTTGEWKPIYFKSKETEACWRYEIIKLLRKQYANLDLSAERYSHIKEERDWSHFLDSQYQRHWKLHFAQKTDNIMQTAAYIGRYLKRPPIAGSRLHHYSNGGFLTLKYLDHRTDKTERLRLRQVDLIARLVEHIPDKGFRMIRYFGFLSNRRRGEMLPKVYDALEMAEKEKPVLAGFAAMLKAYVKVDPFECILCESRLVFAEYRAGSSVSELSASTLMSAKKISII